MQYFLRTIIILASYVKQICFADNQMAMTVRGQIIFKADKNMVYASATDMSRNW